MKHSITARHVLAPIVQIARKQRVGQQDADEIALPVLIHLAALPSLDVGLMNDACKMAERFLDAVPTVKH